MKNNSKLAVAKPWGREVILERNRWYTVKILEVLPGRRLSLQYHRWKVESVYVLSGEVVDRGLFFTTGDFFHVPRGQMHRFETRAGCRLLEVSHGRNEDIVRLLDDYNRV